MTLFAICTIFLIYLASSLIAAGLLAVYLWDSANLPDSSTEQRKFTRYLCNDMTVSIFAAIWSGFVLLGIVFNFSPIAATIIGLLAANWTATRIKRTLLRMSPHLQQ